MKHKFFGTDDCPLFGVYHRPRGIAKSPTRAVLICPPVGHEFIRTHWCLRLMANQLARNGCHVLRLDYHGIGDSAGSLEDIETLSQWTDNIATGIEYLKELSGAPTVMLAGLRFGATLASAVARERIDVNGLVAWEPVVNGAQYLRELRTMHKRMLDLRISKMATPNDQEVEEILGSRFSRSLINEIERVENHFDKVIQPQLIVVPEKPDVRFEHPEPTVQKIVANKDEYNWGDLRTLETVWLRSQTARSMVGSINEMFLRLQKYNAIQIPVTTQQGVTPATGVLS